MNVPFCNVDTTIVRIFGNVFVNVRFWNVDTTIDFEVSLLKFQLKQN